MSDILHTLSQSDDQQDIYERKYYALKRKCEEVQQVGTMLDDIAVFGVCRLGTLNEFRIFELRIIFSNSNSPG